jgi:hypothetical protein
VGALAIVVGLLLVGWMVLDSFETLLATGLGSGRWTFSSRYYRLIWKAYRSVCVRLEDDLRRERWLARFGPMSFLALLGAWALLEILGWGLVWWGFRHSFLTPLHGISDAWYYSGVVYFSIGFGDVLPATGGLRALTVLEGFTGLGTLGMVIGYLPSLYAAYSARERQLLLLDDLTDARITPVSLVSSHLNADRDLAELNAMFDEWASWCAEVYDSHTSLPVLIWFRSKHRGQSWVTALGVVTDAAISFAGAVEGADTGPAMRLHRQAVRLMSDLAHRIGLPPNEVPDLTARWWSVGYSVLQQTGLPLRDFDESWGRIVAMRRAFHPYMEAFIDELLAPRGFWGVTAADHMAEADFSRLFLKDGEEDPAGDTA